MKKWFFITEKCTPGHTTTAPYCSWRPSSLARGSSSGLYHTHPYSSNVSTILHCFCHRLNMELDLQSFIWAPCAQLYSLAETPQPPLPPPPTSHLGSYIRALLVSRDRRHCRYKLSAKSSLLWGRLYCVISIVPYHTVDASRWKYITLSATMLFDWSIVFSPPSTSLLWSPGFCKGRVERDF
jgi:hypothetical protein